MARTDIADATNLTVAQVLHKRCDALGAGATVAEVRDWFAASSHRRMAFLSEEDRYVGSLTREDLEGEVDPRAPAADFAHDGPTVDPDAPARVGYEVATRTPARRVPAVDSAGKLLGVVAVTDDLGGFCGTS